MSTKTKILVFVILTVGAFLAGRYSTPEKIRVETKIVEVEKKTEDSKTDTDKHKETKTVTETAPDGTTKIITIIVEDENKKTEDKKTSDSVTNRDETKEITRNRSKLSISVLGGTNFLNPPLVPIYGAHVTYSVLGPITVGAFGLSNLTFGVSIGLNL